MPLAQTLETGAAALLFDDVFLVGSGFHRLRAAAKNDGSLILLR